MSQNNTTSHLNQLQKIKVLAKDKPLDIPKPNTMSQNNITSHLNRFKKLKYLRKIKSLILIEVILTSINSFFKNLRNLRSSSAFYYVKNSKLVVATFLLVQLKYFPESPILWILNVLRLVKYSLKP